MAELYCLCQEPADDRFMIACDKCEEWFHGECINVKESEAGNIKYYYCPKCCKRDPTLKTKYRKKKDKKLDKERKKEKKRDSPPSKPKKSRIILQESDDDDNFDQFLSDQRKTTKPPKKDPLDVFGDSDEEEKPKKKPSPVAKEEKPILMPEIVKTKKEPKFDIRADVLNVTEPESKKSRKRRDSGREQGPQLHCHGPKCVLPARKKSKYCSDQCGRNLASERIKQLLPKIQAMREHPSVATIEQYYRIDKLKLKYATILEIRNDLEAKFEKLEEVIAFAKKKSIINPDPEDEITSGEEPMIFCFVCGHLRPSRTLVDHIDKCYRRVEAETSYGSEFETKVEGSKRLFCDTYNSTTNRFCKRLKVMCAEHSKEPKPDDNEVCGCPLSPDDFYNQETSEIATCRIAKKSCRKHFLWEKMYRAEIDLKRIRALIKMDQNLEERRKLERGIDDRLGAALLLLNNTVCHTDIRDLRSETRKNETKEIEDKLRCNIDVVGL